MNIERVFEIFRETGVMLDGHFLFTSGRHGDKYCLLYTSRCV